MNKRQFKTESKKVLDLMINSVYTNRDIFLRELISNASDAIDKLYYKALTDDSVVVDRDEFQIKIDIDEENRVISISDNGIGMTEDELDENLGIIAKSGSSLFKEINEKQEDISIIGQFGVGFYSAFMVAKKIVVRSLAFGSDKAYEWISDGADGYVIEECDKNTCGTEIILHIKDNVENDCFDEYLNRKRLKGIVKKYSDYIKYPIVMEKDDKFETLNSMIPIWKRSDNEVTEEEYNSFYADKYYDFDVPLKVVHSKVEGQICYDSLLFVPSHAAPNYYTKEYEKGLQLYSNGVLIMDKCSELLPDYFSFINGLVDSEDISLNLSREVLQQNRQVQLIAKSLEKKIKNILEEMLEDDREKYEKFFDSFGMQLKYGIYGNYGLNNEVLKDLVMFYSSYEKKRVTLSEYVSRMKDDQENIYYVSGENVEKIDMLPIVERFKDKNFEILYLTEYVDEFTLQSLMEYSGHKFINITNDKADIDSDEEKEELKKKNADYKDMFSFMNEVLDDVKEVRFTNKLKKHPVYLSTEGSLSLEMEKVLNSMPDAQKVKAEVILEINEEHPIAEKLKFLYDNDKSQLEKYSKILYNQARLIEGLEIENPTELTNIICDLMSK